MTLPTAQAAARLELIEHVTTCHPRTAMTESQGAALLARFGRHVNVEFPTPRTESQWALTPKGWVGVFAVDATLTVVSRPKLPVRNLAHMLRVVYDLPVASFDALAACATLPELYDQLAAMFAEEASALVRRGLHHAYRPREERRAAVRGRVLVAESLRGSADPRLACRFGERTADVLENQLVLEALRRVLYSGLCSDPTQRHVRRSYRQFQGAATPTALTATDCDRVRYDRLTGRYRRAHALCRLFLETSAPVAEHGPTAVVPFLLHMPTLYERFVAMWLDDHFRRAGSAHRVVTQEHHLVGHQNGVAFYIDLVIYDAHGRAVCVLDTKYKLDSAPASGDVAQVGYYALLKGCRLAGLVYPGAASGGWAGWSGPVMTFGASFDLGSDLEVAGAVFLDQLTRHMRATTN